MCPLTVQPVYAARMPAEQAPASQPRVYVREACRSCGRKAKRHTRQGLYWRCSCGTYNLGPKLRAELAKLPEPEARQRETRRARAAEQRAEREQSAAAAAAVPPAPHAAPVRRRRPPQKAAAGAPSASPAPPPAAVRRSFLDRIVYGGDE